ncbi:glycosyl hydrolase 115 family protein [Marinoscillum sp.]|uniref:glycosyl hydrolase 115 family protein n=1 Tax=Marinoscillum sp. TaxID=2024838 RepID=UPI003BACA99E
MFCRIAFLFSLLPVLCGAQVTISYDSKPTNDFFRIVGGQPTYLLTDSLEDPLIGRVAGMLVDDIERVTDQQLPLRSAISNNLSRAIIIGTVEHSKYIRQLLDRKKLDASTIVGQWERYLIETVQNPFPGIKEALVIAGSDRRGAAYGALALSEAIGVSPWYYWADVPVIKEENVSIKKERFVSKGPSVKYRGIFLNDEAPALRGWAEEQFGGFNHEFYEKVFELILRLKGNYLWPAMWRPTAFADDDSLNAKLADEYGIVVSTSHHEPMMRAHDEWSRYGGGEWNYQTNKEELQEFWRGGVERMQDYESVVTVGMRGDGDEAMGERTAVKLMQEIVRDQRTIIEEVTGRSADQTPQVWAIYKEVQDYYDKGMRVPNDIMVLFCDDNWGNVRILPKKADQDYPGGYGMYYHFDFVGGPVSYRWQNVTQIERVWEQMNLTYEWGVHDLWIVNVGDLKPMEFPISFFLDFAWNAEMKAADLPSYYTNWAKQQFGAQYAQEIGDIISLYTKYNARRTPEMLKPDTYSLENYREADEVLAEWQHLASRSQQIYESLSAPYRDAFYQLVLSPVLLCANLNEMYIAAGENQLYARQGRASANFYADKTKELFTKDAELTEDYHQLNDGKWNHFMDQTHIGYESWNNPPVNKMPPVTYIQPRANAGLGYLLEQGEPSPWTRSTLFSSTFQPFDPVNDQEYYIEVFNQGKTPLDYSIQTSEDWIKLSSTGGTIEYEEKVYVSIDWGKVPEGTVKGEVTISGGGRDFKVTVPLRSFMPVAAGFVENNGVIAIDAAKPDKMVTTKEVTWSVVPNMGRTGSSITMEPADAPVQQTGKKSPMLQYTFTALDSGQVTIATYLSPTLNYKKEDGLKYAIAIDDEEPQVINIHEGETQPDWEYPDWWNNSVTDHIKKKLSTHRVNKPGVHTLKVWMIDPGVVFQKFVLNSGGLKESYLGPPTSVYAEE